jgi:transposase-like protein
MDFPLEECLDEAACYQRLVDVLHPGGLACPRCRSRTAIGVHRRRRPHVPDYRCRQCGRVFNAWTGTLLQKTRRSPAQWLLILRGVAQGVPTAQLARELGCDRIHLLQVRHRLQARAEAGLDQTRWSDAVLEADEMYQNAGEKRRSAPRPRRPAPAARQRPPRSRHVRHRPSAGARRGRPHEWTGAAPRGANRG